jgi:hypothetical protein
MLSTGMLKLNGKEARSSPNAVVQGWTMRSNKVFVLMCR